MEDFGIITNAYNKDNVKRYQRLINRSKIRYIEPNKKRTNNWLSALGLQLPSAITNYGSINKITVADGFVNMNMNQDRNITDSDGNTLTKQQQEFFKDCKLLDEDGKLKVMYHGTARADRVGY